MNNNIHSAVSAPQWNHVSAAILNGGAIRASVDERSRNGEAWREEKGEKVEREQRKEKNEEDEKERGRKKGEKENNEELWRR